MSRLLATLGCDLRLQWRNGFYVASLFTVVGILFVPAVFAWFVPWPWQELAGVVPHYWPLKVFWEFAAGRALSGWLHAAIGIVYLGGLVMLFARHLARVTRR